MSKQQTLEGSEAQPSILDKFDEVEFYYYETNYTPVLKDSEAAYKKECIEQAGEYLQLSSRINTSDMTDEELESLAEEFVEVIFDSVWDLIDSEGYSLWIKYGDKFEMPIYIKSPVGMFTSSTMHGNYGHGQTQVSETFLKSVGQLTQEENSPWSNCEEELWDSLGNTEKELFVKVRDALIGMSDMSPELVALIEKGKRKL